MRWMKFFVVATALAIYATWSWSGKVTVPAGTIVFLGDSITAGYGLGPEQAYPALIEIKGMTMLNLGVSGSKTGDGLQRLRDYFQGGGNPQLVVIALGANDILHGVPAETTVANLKSAVEECKSRKIPVLLCGIWTPGLVGTAQIFEQVAKQEQVPLLPDLMAGEQTQPALLQEDGMHPNAAGQKLIAGKMQSALLKSFSFDVEKR